MVVHQFGTASAPPLVLLHGLTEAGTTWPDAIDRWGGAWHILAPDQRGHGQSPRLDQDQLRALMDTWVDDLVQLLASLDRPGVVVGHSLGGRVASVAAAAHPDLFRGLLLEDPALGDMSVTPPGFAEENLAFLATFDHGGEHEKQRMRRDSPWAPAEIDAWADCKPLVDRAIFQHLELGSHTASSLLNQLQVPVLVVWDADGPLAVDASRITNPNVRVEYLDGVGHCIRRDDPRAFHAIADPWLASLNEPGPRPRPG